MSKTAIVENKSVIVYFQNNGTRMNADNADKKKKNQRHPR